MKRILLTLALAASTLIAQGPGGPGGGPPGGGAGGGGNSGDGIWRRNAYYGEALTFDSCLGHQPQTGQYHYHAHPVCLRAELGDNLVTLRTGRTGSSYAEQASGWHHSPILGWALDGYPIYGPYGYADPTNASSPVRRIVSSFQLRNITTRTTLPTWSLPNHTGVSQTLTSAQYGPAVSTQFPLGRYLEDFDYIAGLGDLDQYNGRFTVTPEFPQGTYAYFTTIDASGKPAFPYILAGQFYGTASGNFPTSVTGTTTAYFTNGVYATTSTTPALTSWSTKYSNQNAAIVSGFDPSAGPVTTWPGTNSLGVTTSGSVTTPVRAETQSITYNASSIYITANALAGYNMGPWFSSDMTAGIFSNFPSALNTTFQMPATPAKATTLTSTSGGPQGLWVNGVYVFNFIDGASYSQASGNDAGGGNSPSYLAAITSAASFELGPIAPGSLVTAYGYFFTTFSSTTASATSPSWPTALGDTTVTITDSANTKSSAQIFYISPSQINFRMPTGLATGAAKVSIVSGGNTISSNIQIMPVYPNLFMYNATALSLAIVTRVHNGVQTVEPVYQVSGGAVVSAPIALNGDSVYLTFYGSGLGTAASSSSPNATVTVGGVAATVSYAGPDPTYSGLDQYNILIPASLAGKGKVDIVVTAGGKKSNPVNITLQ